MMDPVTKKNGKMKILAALLACSLCVSLLLPGCNSAEAEPQGAAQNSAVTQEEPITEEPITFETLETRQVSTERAALETWTMEDFEGKTIEESQMLLELVMNPTLENAAATATQVVRGTVAKVEYTCLGYNPWTILSVSVEETLEGEIEPGRMIDVYVFGGYAPLRTVYERQDWAHGTGEITEEDLDTKVVYDTWEGSNTAEEGGTYIFYLVEPNEESSTPSDGYECGMGSFGQLEVNEDGTFTGREYPTGEAVTYTQEEIPLP